MRSLKTDVLVVGGGTAGCIAAIASARVGAKTLIIEKQECLGGQWTAGMLGLWVGFGNKEKVIVRGIPWEIRTKLKKLGAIVENNPETDPYALYDPETAKLVLDEIVGDEPNLSVYYNSTVIDVIMEDNAVAGAIVCAGSEEVVVSAKVIVDCSGDAVVAAKAGAPFWIQERSALHPVTVIGKFCNVDVDKLSDYYKKNPPKLDPPCNPAFGGFTTFPHLEHYGLKDELKDIRLPPRLEYFKKGWMVMFNTTPHPGEVLWNMTGDILLDCTHVEDVIKGEITSRKRLRDGLEVAKMCIPGMENAYIASTASLLGVRETRRIEGEYTISVEDATNARSFEDAVALTGMAMGYHPADGTDIVMTPLKKGATMGIPYRCLLPKKVENLLVAGRCTSYVPEVADTMRNMVQCMAMGEATGTAAALAVIEGVTPRALNIRSLRKKLSEQGVAL